MDTVHINGLQIARIYFDIRVGELSLSAEQLPIREERHRKAFASYSSADHDEVLALIRGIKKAAPTLEIFMDVLSLRSGQDWEKELWNAIPASDVFYLFWSRNAKRSKWVKKEWQCALKTRGLYFIDPVPLEEVEPPRALKKLHFYDPELAFKSS